VTICGANSAPARAPFMWVRKRIQPFIAERLATTSKCSMRYRASVEGARAGALSAQQTVTRRRQAGGGVLR